MTPAGVPSVRRTAVETEESLGVGVSRARQGANLQAAQVFQQVSNQALGVFAQQQASRRREDEERAEREDRLVALGGENQLREWIGTTSTSEQGPFARQGPQAIGVAGEFRDAFNKYADQVAGSMTNERQRAAFEAVRARLGTDFQLDLERHTFTETNKYQDQEFVRKIDNITSTVARAASDPARVSREVAAGDAAILEQATDRGWGKEQTEAAMLAFRTQAYTNVIQSLTAQGNSAGAEAYFTAVKGQIDTSALAEIQQNIRIGTVKDQSRKAATEILLGGGTEAEQLAKADAIENTDVSDATKARLEHQHRLNKSQEIESYQKFQDDVYTRLYTQKRRGDLSFLAPADIQRLGKDFGALQAEAKRLAEGPARKTSEKGERRYWDLIDMAHDRPDEFAALSLWNDKHLFSDTDFDRLMTMRRTVLTNKQTGTDSIDGDSPSVKAMFAETWVKYTGVDVSPTEAQVKDDPTLTGRIATMRTAVRDEVEKLPKNTDPARIQEVIDRVFSQQVTQPATRGGYGLYGLLSRTPETTKKIFNITIADIPATEKAKITAGIRAAGLTVNDPTILEWYLRALARRQ